MAIPFDPNTMDLPELPVPPPDLPPPAITRPEDVIPPPLLTLPPEKREWLIEWLRQQVQLLMAKHGELERFYVDIEDAYRAPAIADQGFPFKGHATETMPVIASTIAPISARLATGINKQDPPLRVIPLKKSVEQVAPALEKWVNFRRKYLLRMPETTPSAYLELCKLGTMVPKTTFEVRETRSKEYVLQADGSWKVETVTKEVQQPKVEFIPSVDVIWPAGYTSARDLPIIIERQQWTVDDLLRDASGDNPHFDPEAVKAVILQATTNRTLMEDKREEMNRDRGTTQDERIELYECWFWFDPEQDPSNPLETRKEPSHLVATLHLGTSQLLQLRYNYYFHQTHPYDPTAYVVASGSLRGLGVGEMSKPFQEAITRWYRMASDNAYLANIRMFATPKGAMKDLRIEMFAGRNINNFANPQTDIRELKLSDTYPSTLSERNTLSQMNQSLTGSNDYLGGNESPVVGSRATATSTLALIQEAKSRVEEVTDNIRKCESAIAMKCLSFDVQFGPGSNLDDALDEDEAALVRAFLDSISVSELDGALAIDLTATDAAGNKNVQQQNLMAAQQILDGYNGFLLQMWQTGQQMPQLIPMLLDMADAKRSTLRDTLTKMSIPSPDHLLPDLREYLQPPPPQGLPQAPPPEPPGGPAGAGGPPGAGLPPDMGGVPGPGAGPLDAGTGAPTGIGGIDRAIERVQGAYGGA